MGEFALQRKHPDARLPVGRKVCSVSTFKPKFLPYTPVSDQEEIHIFRVDGVRTMG